MNIEIKRSDKSRVKIDDKCIEPDPSKLQTPQQPSNSGKRKLNHVLCVELPVVADGFELAVEFTPAVARLDSWANPIEAGFARNTEYTFF